MEATLRDAEQAYVQSSIRGPGRPSCWVRLPRAWWPSSWFDRNGEPTLEWFSTFWTFALASSTPRATAAALAEGAHVLPTADGQLVTLGGDGRAHVWCMQDLLKDTGFSPVQRFPGPELASREPVMYRALKTFWSSRVAIGAEEAARFTERLHTGAGDCLQNAG